MIIFIASVCLFSLFFLLMSVRVFLKKDGEFRGTCATQSPYLTNKEITCGVCGKPVDSKTTCVEK